MTEVLEPSTLPGDPYTEADMGAGAGAGTASGPVGAGRPPGWGTRWRRLAEPDVVITLLVVAACTVFVFFQLQPSQLFRDTTPAGGDMGAHVWLPAYLKRVLLPHFQIFGWTMDWYAGFPALTYYFPLPMLAIAVVSYVLPYDIAFKLVSVAGLVTLPLACWALGRLARVRFPTPACLAAAAVPFLFSREFTIYGGNIASTMAGEFSFSISLSFALLFLGLVARGLRTGRGRILAAVMLACCGLSHILPLFFAIGGSLVFLLLYPRRRWQRPVLGRMWLGIAALVLGGVLVIAAGLAIAGVSNTLPVAIGIGAVLVVVLFLLLWVQGRALVWLATVGVVGGLLLAFWALPFEIRLPYATNMGYGKLTNYVQSLFPSGDIWLFMLAAAGAGLAIARGNLIGRWLAITAFLAAIVFCIAPTDRLWNARVLPFWFLCLYLLAGVAFVEAGSFVVEAVEDWWRRPDRLRVGTAVRSTWGLLPVPVVTLLVALIWTGFPLRILPLGYVTSAGQYDWLGITSSDNSFVPDWVTWNYSGYQAADKSSRTTYFALIDEMRKIGAEDGCGRSMYEYEPAINDMGTPDALMLLPYWTNGCIATMEGLYYESSATTPYHFLNAAELSEQPSNPMRGLDYPSAPDVAEGIQHLQMFGVRYFLAVSPAIQRAAAANPSLHLLASVGPYPTSVSSGGTTTTQEQTWKIYLVSDSSLVQPLANQPVVVPHTLATPTTWLQLSEAWYLDPSRWDVYIAASGPKSWARVTADDTKPPVKAEPKVTVTNIRLTEESVSFDVSRVGVPMLVKVSYYPNWHVSGAEGVYRVTPNLMLVVPTSTHVSLTYGYTPVDWIGFILSLFGVAAVVVLWRRRRIDAWDLAAAGADWGPPAGNDGRPPPGRRGSPAPTPAPGTGPPEDPEFWGGVRRTRAPLPPAEGTLPPAGARTPPGETVAAPVPPSEMPFAPSGPPAPTSPPPPSSPFAPSAPPAPSSPSAPPPPSARPYPSSSAPSFPAPDPAIPPSDPDAPPPAAPPAGPPAGEDPPA